MMTRSRLLPTLLLLAACGGGGGGSTTPTAVLELSATGGNGQTAAVTQGVALPLQVKLTSDGVPVVGQTLHFAPGASAGSATTPNPVTGADGIASSGWTLGTAAGIRNMTVTATGLNVTAINFTATATAGPASLFSIFDGQSQDQQINTAFSRGLQVSLQDTFGNPISGVTVSWTATGPVQLAGPSSVTGADGRALMTATAQATPGAATVNATIGVLPDTLVFGLTVTPIPSIVTVSSNFFSPGTDTIPAGGAIKWVWNGNGHNVTQVSGPATFPASATQNSGATYGPLVFDVPGTYTYQCTIHAGMTGTFVVQ